MNTVVAFAISGPTSICGAGSIATYSVQGSTASTGYQWQIPTGATVISGAGTNKITLKFNSVRMGNYLAVTGNSVSESLIVHVYQSGISAGPISGSSIVCTGQTKVTYSIPSVQYATGYSWIVPNGATKVSESGNTVTLSFQSSFTSGTLYAYAIIPSCGATAAASLFITASSPPSVPTANSNQAFCVADDNNPTIANLVASSQSGSTLKWYSTASGGNPLVDVEVLTHGMTYYAQAQYNSGCVSPTRKAVSVSVASIVKQPESVLLWPGDTWTLEVLATGSNLTYQWRKDMISIPGANSSRLTISNVAYTHGGKYDVVVTNNGACKITSNAASLSVSSPAQIDATTNYIISRKINRNDIYSESQIDGLTVQDMHEYITYFDGLGRPIQSINNQGSPNRKDIVQPFEYDENGKETKKYLIYSDGSQGYYKYNMIHRQAEFYSSPNNDIPNDNYPYAEIIYEVSPLNRIMEQGAPGADWQPGASNIPNSGHSVKFNYQANVANEVLLLQVSTNGNLAIGKTINGTLSKFYPANELYKTIVKDENWTSAKGKLHTTEEFKDKQGRVVLKRAYVENSSGVDKVDTYYVYDDLGLLRYVISPKALAYFASTSTSSFAPTNNYIKELCYHYKYDGLKRMIEKKIPGAAVVYMVYDLRDRLVATQDGEQRKSNQWLFTKYDQLNRPVLTGLWIQTTAAKTREALQSLVDTYNDASSDKKLYETRGSVVHSYTNNSFPSVTNTNSYLTVTYYDDYTWKGTQSATDTYYNTLKSEYSSHGFTGITVPAIEKSDRVKGQVTGTKVKVLDGSNTWLETVMWYDDRYRPILVQSDNYVGGEDIVLNHYDFPGKLLESWVCHKTNLTTPGKRILRQINSYDHAGRLLTTKQQMTGATQLVTIAENSYNELGQLKTKKVGNAVQQMDYQYNIRGWLTRINDPEVAPTAAKKLSLRLRYTDPIASLAAQAQYNGNISAIEWRTFESTGGSPNTKQGYGFEYDALNRLSTSVYGDGASLTSNKNRFNESITGYDLNGNITGLVRRNNNQEVDRLAYSYDTGGNQLTRVADNAPTATRAQIFLDGNTAGNDYSYDLNGNMTQDKNKGITQVSYNYLNLPQKIVGGSQTIEYIYSANGQKLQKKAPNNEITRYSGNFIYEGTSLKQVLHGEGYIDMSGTATYHYYLKDHLGNNRMVVNQGGTVVQQTDYYPFGMTFNKSGSSDNKYLYNGKELQEDAIGNGFLDWLDYGARMYDPTLGRWHAVDPLAEKYADWSPYNYVGNNPIKRIDPDGRDWDVVINHDQQAVTIKANFNTINGSKGTVQKAADSWNAQSGKFSYVVGKGDDAVSYSVNFEVTAQNPEGGADNTITVLADDAKVFTSRTRTDENGSEVKSEGLSDGRNIGVKESNKENSQITSHEMGHNMGMGHSSGLMQTTVGGKSLSKTSVKETLGHSGVGKGVKGAATKATLQNKTVVGTAPENFQEGKLKRNNDWEKKNFK